MDNKLVGAAIAVLGIVGIKLYGEYKYYCGRVDCHGFYKPVIDGMNETIKDLRNQLKTKEKKEKEA